MGAALTSTRIECKNFAIKHLKFGEKIEEELTNPLINLRDQLMISKKGVKIKNKKVIKKSTKLG
jgi:hypothetical protein